MKPRLIHLFFALLLLLSASLVIAQDDTDATIAGEIAIIGEDYNVYIWDEIGADLVQLTDDALTTDDSTRRYQMPTWATDGRLAYFGIQVSREDYVTEVFVSAEGVSSEQPIYVGEDEVLNYAYWSPQNCSATETCRELAMLLNSRVIGGLFVKLVEDQVIEGDARIIGRGGPFYFSWSANGENMIWQRNNNRLDVYNLLSGEIDTQLDQQPGRFQTPHWSPVDDRVLVGARGEQRATTDLIVVEGGVATTLVEALEVPVVYFSWSPDGEQVAYTTPNDVLTVVNARTGDTVSQSLVESVGPFFWSPDSSKIAFVTLATPEGTFTTNAGVRARPVQQGMPDLAWSVLDVATGESRRYSAFVPTQRMAYILTYFDQFAKSHSLWSPDSRYIVYSEFVESDDV
ncbi:MAG: hypothetical protein AAF125_17585, partial [Chloroflexota bacterium]